MIIPLNQREPDPGSGAPSRARQRWLARLTGLALLCVVCGTCLGAEKAALKEHQLKAAFIYNFTKFIEWPASGFPDTNAPFVVAVAGATPCAAELEQIARDRKVNGRELIINVVKTPEAARGAHVLFVPAAEEARLKDWLAAVRGTSVLTIGESESFLKEGGIINFMLEGEKIRFEIEMDQADVASLKVSAQLQKLARTVRRKRN